MLFKKKKLFKNSLIPAFIALVMIVAIKIATRTGHETPIIAAGRVVLATDLVEKAQGIQTLFVTVFDAESASPMPYGSIRYQLSGAFKHDVTSFTLTHDNLQIMNPNAPMPKTLRVKARLDQNGRGGADSPGDLTGEIALVTPGSQNLEIQVDHRVPIAQ